ncbi:MAG TPA: hypothetical protein VNI82_00450 [Candidatus Nitrosotenuis sp.]|nr:hypothetical protein [Candidatus Nitrosotenuis sp.]
METIKRNQGWIVFILSAILLVTLLMINMRRDTETSTAAISDASSQINDEDSREVKLSQTKQPADAKQTGSTSYRYIAQPGDSYSVLARKAIQTYGIVNKVKLSQAQIVAAESQMALDAGSPLLNEAQGVTFDPIKVKSAVEAAQKLSTADIAAWQVYVPEVNFNTNANGQVAS